MTAICGGGTSGPKAGVDLVTAYTASRLAQLAVLRGVSWTNPYLGLLGLLPIVVSSFCGSDPPAMSALSSAEVAALSGQTFDADYFSALAKIKDTILNAIWLDICQCTSGSLSTPSFPSPTTGTPIYQGPAASTTPCRDYTEASGVANNSTSGAAQIVNGHPDGGVLQSFSLLGGTVTLVEVTFVNTTVSGGGATGSTIIQYVNQAGGVLANVTFGTTPGLTLSVTSVPPLGADRFSLVQSTSGSGTVKWDGTRCKRWCNGDQPNVASPCAPDAATLAQLDAILSMVKLIQRQAVPFAYVPGTTHTGLSGAGVIDVSGLIGAKADITTLPDRFGREGTSPLEIFDLGFITWGTPDGWPSSFRLEHDPLVMFPRSAGLYTEIRYDLEPGVVITLTELLREP
jgi:hypothetical protein